MEIFLLTRSHTTILALASTVLLSGCGCDTYASAGLVVDLRDAVTGAAITGPEVRILARDGAYVDSARYAPAQLAVERAGVYAVTVEASGYRVWQQPGVRVREDGCHVRTTALTASLQRAP